MRTNHGTTQGHLLHNALNIEQHLTRFLSLPALAILGLVNISCYRAIVSYVVNLPTIVAFELEREFARTRVFQLNLLSGQWHEAAGSPIPQEYSCMSRDGLRGDGQMRGRHQSSERSPEDYAGSMFGKQPPALFMSRAAFCDGRICLVRTRSDAKEGLETVIETLNPILGQWSFYDDDDCEAWMNRRHEDYGEECDSDEQGEGILGDCGFPAIVSAGDRLVLFGGASKGGTGDLVPNISMCTVELGAESTATFQGRPAKNVIDYDDYSVSELSLSTDQGTLSRWDTSSFSCDCCRFNHLGGSGDAAIAFVAATQEVILAGGDGLSLESAWLHHDPLQSAAVRAVNVWTGTVRKLPDLPVDVSGCRIVHHDDGLYVLGGNFQHTNNRGGMTIHPMRDVYHLDLLHQTPSWNKRLQLTTARKAPVALSLHGLIWVVGGTACVSDQGPASNFHPPSQCHPTLTRPTDMMFGKPPPVECFDPTTGQHYSLPPFSTLAATICKTKLDNEMSCRICCETTRQHGAIFDQGAAQHGTASVCLRCRKFRQST